MISFILVEHLLSDIYLCDAFKWWQETLTLYIFIKSDFTSCCLSGLLFKNEMSTHRRVFDSQLFWGVAMQPLTTTRSPRHIEVDG